MSVVGFDFGNSNCVIAIARAGGVEVIDNSFSDRSTPACVAFTEKIRLTGNAAKNQSDVKNRIVEIKRFVGRQFDDPIVQQERLHMPFTLVRGEDGGVCFQVKYRNEDRIFSAEQVLAMLLQELRTTASKKLGIKVSDCVISVPCYFTDCQRVSVLNAAGICGLNCLKVMNETTAVALSYGLFKQDLPTLEEPARNVAFVDIGHSAIQVCIAAFNKGKIKVLSVASDPCLGGRNFDNKLLTLMAAEFKVKPGIDVLSNPKARSRLMKDIEGLKKKMSALKNELTLSIECLMDDKDVMFKYTQAQFAELCADLFAETEVPMQQAISESGLKVEEIQEVEIVGGSTRIPAIKEIIKRVFNKEELKTTLNADEVVARGCAIQCAMLSHSFRVRDIDIQDACTYPISLCWDAPNDKGQMVIFNKHHTFPATKMLTLPRKEPFKFWSYYGEDLKLPHTVKSIGEYTINGVHPDADDEPSKVKVKVRINQHGCFTLHSASMVEKLPTPPPSPVKEEPMETNGVISESVSSETPADNAPVSDPPVGDAPQVNGEVKMETENTENQTTKEENKPSEEPTKPASKEDTGADQKMESVKKKKTKSTELPFNVINHAYLSSEQISNYLKIENELLGQIEFERQLGEAKNAVEEYVYELREASYDKYNDYLEEEERETISNQLMECEDWLYGEGEHADKKTYEEKLKEIKSYGFNVEERFRLHNSLPAAFELFGACFMHYNKILSEYRDGNEKYNHLSEEDMKKVEEKLNDRFNWYNQQCQEFTRTKKTSMPKIESTLLNAEKKGLESFCNPIVNKPKPKVEPPPVDVKAGETATDGEKKSEKEDTAPTPDSETGTMEDTVETKIEDVASENKLDMEVD